MRTKIILLIFLLVACAKKETMKAPTAAYNDSVLATPAYERSGDAESVPGENADTVIQLEALIERDLYAMGLPTMREQQSTTMGYGAATGLINPTPPTIASNPQTLDANEANKIPEKSPTPTANVGGRENKNKTKTEDDKKGKKYAEAEKDKENSCQKTCALIDNICDAAKRICQITEKFPNDPEAPQRCTRAENACTRAQTQGTSCPCST